MSFSISKMALVNTLCQKFLNDTPTIMKKGKTQSKPTNGLGPIVLEKKGYEDMPKNHNPKNKIKKWPGTFLWYSSWLFAISAKK